MSGVRLSKIVLGLALFLAGCQTTSVTFKSGSLVGGTSADALVVRGLLFKPAGAGPFPAVVLLHTCGGLTQHMRQGWPDFLTANGYVVFAVDSYPPRGHRSCDQFPNRFEWEIGQAEDAFGALDYLAAQPFVDGDRIGVMGFSAGAFAINHLVIGAPRGEARQFKAAIALYGSCDFSSLVNYSTDDVPLLQIAAELDTKLAPRCVRLGKRTPMEVLLLEGTYHAFDQPQINRLRYDGGGHPMRYSASATKQARQASKDFLDSHL
jgi:dienelactone hydrolase